MEKNISISDSIIGSLIREVSSIESRSEIINHSICSTNDSKLTLRLKKELLQLKIRIQSIQALSQIIKNKGQVDTLSIDFLNEVIGRSLIHTLV